MPIFAFGMHATDPNNTDVLMSAYSAEEVHKHTNNSSKQK